MTGLPEKLIFIPNADKVWHEKWEPNRSLLNIPHPCRAILMGPPNVGKSTICINLAIKADPPFKEIIIVHVDAEFTEEYDCLYNYNSKGERVVLENGKFADGVSLISEIPQPSEFDGQVKTLVILDDLDTKNMRKDQKSALSRLYGFCSTHKNISVYLCSQDPFQVPPVVRRCSNLFILWKLVDLDSMAMCCRKTGLVSGTLKRLFNKHMTEPRDSLWVDLSSHSPAKLRKNGYEKIKDT